MKNIEHEIELINNIIEESVIHGGDAGGAYFSNSKKVCSAIQKWLNYHDLSDTYIVKDQKYYDDEGERIYFNTYPQIYKKGDK
jgi:hypothetical protein